MTRITKGKLRDALKLAPVLLDTNNRHVEEGFRPAYNRFLRELRSLLS